MNNVERLIRNVRSSRKRTAIIYCQESFRPIIEKLEVNIDNLKIFDCIELCTDTLTFSASELLNKLEYFTNSNSTIVLNFETLIVSNSKDFCDQLARLLTIREPLNPLFFLFYSKKLFCEFKNHYESKELNRYNILEI